MSNRNPGLSFIVVLLAGLAWLGDAEAKQVSDWDIELFTRPGCPRCAAAARFLDKLKKQRGSAGDGLKVRELDVSADKVARERLAELARSAGVRALGVPAFLVRGRLLVGFRSEQTTGAHELAFR